LENKEINNGYLVCNRYNGIYQLKSDESADDFKENCECGGRLKFREFIT
jgi:hypothetical protein